MGSQFAVADTAESLKVGGFVDAQFHTTNDYSLTEGVTIHDGAVYVTMKSGKTEAKLDIPFKANFDIASNSTEGANFALGRTKMQAYITHAYDFDFSWKLGQFDTIYGFELNDSPDLVLSRQGFIYNNMIPFMHSGLLLSYKFANYFTFNALASNCTSWYLVYTLYRAHGLHYSALFTPV